MYLQHSLLSWKHRRQSVYVVQFMVELKLSPSDFQCFNLFHPTSSLMVHSVVFEVGPWRDLWAEEVKESPTYLHTIPMHVWSNQRDPGSSLIRQGVGGRRMQRWISLSYFTAMLISTFIDGDYHHSLKDCCFCNMREKRKSFMRFIFRYTYCTCGVCVSKPSWIDVFQLEG